MTTRYCPKCGQMGFSSRPDGISRGVNPYICKHCQWDVRNVYAGGSDETPTRSWSSMNNKTSLPFSSVNKNTDVVTLSIAAITSIFQAIVAIFRFGKDMKDLADRKKEAKEHYNNYINQLRALIENHDETLWDIYTKLGLILIRTNETIGDTEKFCGEKIGFIDIAQGLVWLYSPKDISQISGEQFSLNEAKTKASLIQSHALTWGMPTSAEAKSVRDRLVEFYDAFSAIHHDNEDDIDLELPVENYREFIEFALIISQLGNHNFIGTNEEIFYEFSIGQIGENSGSLFTDERKVNQLNAENSIEVEYFCASLTDDITADIFGLIHAANRMEFKLQEGRIITPKPDLSTVYGEEADTTRNEFEADIEVPEWQLIEQLDNIASDNTGNELRNFMAVNDAVFRGKQLTHKVNFNRRRWCVELHSKDETKEFSLKQLQALIDWVDTRPANRVSELKGDLKIPRKNTAASFRTSKVEDNKQKWENTHLIRAIEGDDTGNGFREFIDLNASRFRKKKVSKKFVKHNDNCVVTLKCDGQTETFDQYQILEMIAWVDRR